MPIAVGSRFGECEVLAVLGAGGMGEVYRARDNLGREVALKVLPEQVTSDPDRLRRFEQEARAAAALSHPNILAVYSFGTTAERVPYLVTELLQGQTLRERLEQGSIPVRKGTDYALQIARGLAAAHERGVVHRDLKPENLFITKDGVVKILDFGLAKLSRAGVDDPSATVALSVTEPGVVLGTAGYMSPEQVRGQSITPRSDLFSLGTVMYEMLAGRRAFHGVSAADTMSAILKEEPPELGGSVADLPPALARIVHRCMEKDPAERFQSARDLAFNLELLARDQSSSTAKAAVARKIPANWLWPAIAVAAMILAATLGFFSARWVEPKTNAQGFIALKRLTDFVGMEEFPALSPDGKAVAFTADISGTRQVWVRLLSGGAPLQVSHDEGDHRSPRWSPDSASVIYFSPSEEPDGQGKIWEIPALGGTARPIVTSLGAGDVSHDGKHIAYFRSNQKEVELAVADRDGTNSRTIATMGMEYTYSSLRWSPDDSKLGFQRGRTFDYDIFYVAADGGEVKKLTDDGNPLAGFAWMPGGSGIVYSSSRGDTVLYLRTMNLWSVDLDGKNLRQLTFGETSYGAPDVDHEGNIVATRSQIEFNLWKYPTTGEPVQNVRDGVRITHQTGSVQTPSAGPGDREIVYLSDSGGHGNLWVINPQTGENRQVTFEQDPQIAVGVPVWSPDGKYIEFVKRSKARWNVDGWLMNADGSNARKVSDGGGWACWSFDSRWLYISPPTDQGFRIEKIPMNGNGGSIPVQADGQKPAVAPDGTLYYVVTLPALNGVSDMEIRKAKPDNAPGTVLTRIPGARLSAGVLMQPVVSPDGKWLALLLTDGASTDIWAQPTAGGPLRRITDFGKQATFIARRVSWSSDGKFIFAAEGKGESDIVLLSHLNF
jgi:serine/threonine protein kinase